MSHTLDFESIVTDPEALKRALIRMGINESRIEISETPIRMRTYHEEERKVAHVVVRRRIDSFSQGKSSDAGWERNDEGVYIGHIDEFNYGCGPAFDAAWQQKLYTYYNVEATKIAFEKQGMEYEEKTLKDGRIQLRAKFKAAPEKTAKIKVHTTR